VVVFISYRRDDTLQTAASLFRSLQRHYKPDDIFFDLPRQSPGAILSDKLTQAVNESDVVVAVIGRHWVGRLSDPDDAVRLEIEVAIDARKRVFVVLAEGAGMPISSQLPEKVRAIRQLEGTVLRPVEFDDDVDVLVAAIEKERQRVREERRLDGVLSQALARDDYPAAVGAAEALVRVASDPESAAMHLQRIQVEREKRRQRAAPLAVMARTLLDEGAFGEATARCEEALAAAPGEPDLVQLSKTIDQRREQERVNLVLERLADLSRCDLIAFVEATEDTRKEQHLTYSQLEPIVTARADDLRRCLVQHPEHLALRRMYLQVRTWTQRKRDEQQAKLIRRACFGLAMFGSWAVYAWISQTFFAFLTFWGVAFAVIGMIQDDDDGRHAGTASGLGLILFIALISLDSKEGDTTAVWVLSALEIGLAVAYNRGAHIIGNYGPLPLTWTLFLPEVVRTAVRQGELSP
jgi:hypothetical protein